MITHTTRLKIMAVGPEQLNMTTKQTTRKVIVTVAELSVDNPFGHTPKEGNAFEVEVYNHNIENFQIGAHLVGEVADCVLDIRHYQTGSASPVAPKFIVSDLKRGYAKR